MEASPSVHFISEEITSLDEMIRHILLLDVIFLATLLPLQPSFARRCQMALFPTLSYALAVDNPSEFINQLSHALLTTGFFYLSDIDQVIPEWKAAWDDVFKVSEQFFQLSLAEKMEIAMLNSRHFRGYSKLGSETTQGKQDLREQIDLACVFCSIPAFLPMT